MVFLAFYDKNLCSKKVNQSETTELQVKWAQIWLTFEFCLLTSVSKNRDNPQYTVVIWGHTEGIEREKTLSQKFTVIALDFWRDEFFLVFQIWGQNTIRGQFLEHYHLIW
jgi:hypothetical protein